MTTRVGHRRMWWLAGVLALAPLMLAPSSAMALFPPVISTPAPVVVIPTTVPAPVANPVGVIVGEPEQPPIVDPPVTAKTPEPATLVTGLIGLAFGSRFLRRKKVQS